MTRLRGLPVAAALLVAITSRPARAETRSNEARGTERPAGPTPTDVALFLPRALLTPPRVLLVLVFVPIRHGLRWLSRAGESPGAPAEGPPRPSFALLPHLSYLSGFGATLGGAVHWQNLGGHGEETILAARFGGIYAQSAQISFHADRAAGSRAWVETVTRYDVRPQQLFQGIGDGTFSPSRFSERRFLSVARGGASWGAPGDVMKVGGSLILEGSRFGPKDDNYSGDPSIESAYDTRALVGFEHGVTTAEGQLNFVVDTRDVAAAASRGVLVNAFAGAVPKLGNHRYLHWGLDVTGHVDLHKKTRVLLVRGAVHGVQASAAEVPFARLPRLGGPDSLRGYRLDRFRDENSALVSLEYRYPVHRWVAGAIFVDAGHVAHSPAGLITFDRWRASVGAGVRIRGERDDAFLFSLDFAYGDGAQLVLTVFPIDAPSRKESR